MTEDEEWELIESRLRKQDDDRCMNHAVIEAQRFIESSKNELGILTLRKAYEMGYKAGYYDARYNKEK